jgi:hypothetical protein
MEREEEKNREMERRTGQLLLWTLRESCPFRIHVKLRGWSTFPLRPLLQI